MEHLQEFVPSRKCKKPNDKKITLDILGTISKLINPFHRSFLQVLKLVILVFFDLIEWKLCFVGMNVVIGWKTTTKTHFHQEVNQAQLFGPLFHQEALHMAKCDGNHFLPSDSHSGQWRFCSWCM